MPVNTTTKFDNLLVDEGLEAIVIATDAITHNGFFDWALLAGKNVYVEKPLVPTSADVLELHTASRSETAYYDGL